MEKRIDKSDIESINKKHIHKKFLILYYVLFAVDVIITDLYYCFYNGFPFIYIFFNTNLTEEIADAIYTVAFITYFSFRLIINVIIIILSFIKGKKSVGIYNIIFTLLFISASIYNVFLIFNISINNDILHDIISWVYAIWSYFYLRTCLIIGRFLISFFMLKKKYPKSAKYSEEYYSKYNSIEDEFDKKIFEIKIEKALQYCDVDELTKMLFEDNDISDAKSNEAEDKKELVVDGQNVEAVNTEEKDKSVNDKTIESEKTEEDLSMPGYEFNSNSDEVINDDKLDTKPVVAENSQINENTEDNLSSNKEILKEILNLKAEIAILKGNQVVDKKEKIIENEEKNEEKEKANKINELYESVKKEFSRYNILNFKKETTFEKIYYSNNVIAKLYLDDKNQNVKIFFALNPNSYDTSIYKTKDVSDKKGHEMTPLMFTYRNESNKETLLKLINDLVQKIILVL